MQSDILIVDDEQDIRGLIKGILNDEGYKTRLAANDTQAYQHLEEALPSLVILDIWLQNSEDDGIEILRKIKDAHPDMPVLMISGHGNIETAVSALKIGAYDFIEKPFKTDRLLVMIERALENAKLKTENKVLKSRIEGPHDLIGSSATMNNLRQSLERVAQSNSRVMITGEAGTGKDIAARYIHKSSHRADEPFVALNCATMLPERLEIELFGTSEDNRHEPGYVGVLERAHKGTLFLDEVADMPPQTQGKIVRVLQEQHFQRVGGHDPVEVDVRVIASSNKDLKEQIAKGAFREDLYYRLNVVPIEMPPLRDHVKDIEELSAYFARLYSEQSGLAPSRFTDDCIKAMQLYEWPGNVRELRNTIERLMIVTGGSKEPVNPAQLSLSLGEKDGIDDGDLHTVNYMTLPLRGAREVFEKEYLSAQLERFSGNISKTAEFIGMERSALHRKLKQLGISAESKQNDNDSVDPRQNDENRKRA